MRAEALAIADVREGGRWTLRQRLKNDLLHAIVKGALAVARRNAPWY